MELTGWLVVVLLIVATIATGVLIYALFEAVSTLRVSRRLALDLEARLPQLIDKVDVAVDAFSAEMLRLDAIIGQVEEATARVNGTVSLIHEVASVPSAAANVASERIRTAWQRMKRARD